MTEAGTERRLAAILAADAAGYSRLMGVSEEGTLAALKRAREIFARETSARKGRLLDTAGDSILAEFPSVVAAVECALAVQAALHSLNSEIVPDRRLLFRIGINLGDVIADGETIYGDGVNVAARLQALAEPGGIRISGTVYNLVRDKLDVGYEFAGKQSVKNIADPVPLYRVRSAALPVQSLGRVQKREAFVVGGLAVAIMLVAASIYWAIGRWDRLVTASGPEAATGVATSANPRRVGTRDPEAQKSYQSGWLLYRRGTPDAFKAALAHFDRAVRLDPDDGRAYAALAAIYWDIWKRSWHFQFGLSPRLRAWEKAKEYLEKAQVRPTTLSRLVHTEMLYSNRRYEQAFAEAQAAIALDANDPLGHVAMANALTFAGRPGEALTSIEKAMRIDPSYPASFLLSLAVAQFGLERYADAAASLEQATAANPSDHISYMLLTATYGHLGRRDKARKAIVSANALHKKNQMPMLTVSSPIDTWHSSWPYKDDADVKRVQTGLRAAGLPEW